MQQMTIIRWTEEDNESKTDGQVVLDFLYNPLPPPNDKLSIEPYGVELAHIYQVMPDKITKNSIVRI